MQSDEQIIGEQNQWFKVPHNNSAYRRVEFVKDNFASTFRTLLDHFIVPKLVPLRTVGSVCLDTVGSCSMLPREDGGVVDNKLKASCLFVAHSEDDKVCRYRTRRYMAP